MKQKIYWSHLHISHNSGSLNSLTFCIDVWEAAIWDVDTIVLVFLVGTASSPAESQHKRVRYRMVRTDRSRTDLLLLLWYCLSLFF